MPWWEHGTKALCPDCKVPCIVRSTRVNEGEHSKTQYRKCPLCGHQLQTVISAHPASDPENN